ncbi:MAG: DUF2341 domain-containing protein, partial [Kiritimatiellae bacterium]|nr:DUF2341 domain-containing protein [Kiritimatiellia bacterium]
MKKSFVSAAVAVLGLCGMAAPAYKAQLTVQGYAGSDALADFPVPVRISESAIPGFRYADCAEDGADIAFADAQGNALAREIDVWNTNGESVVWVKVPSLANGARFFLTYGDAGVAAQPASQTDGSVWAASSHKSVWHMNLANNATASSVGGYTGTVLNPNAKCGSGAGIAGGAYHNEENTTVHNIYTTGLAGFTPDTANVYTISVWARQIGGTAANGKPDPENYPNINWSSTWGNCGALFNSKNGSSDAGAGNELCLEGKGNQYNTFVIRDQKVKTATASIRSFYDKAWHLLTFRYGDGQRTFYIDGVLQPNFTETTTCPNPTGTIRFGSRDNSNSDCVWTGDIDEFRYRSAASSEEWIAAEYASVATPAFLSYGRANLIAAPALATPALGRVRETTAALTVAVEDFGAGASSATIHGLLSANGGAEAETAALASVSTLGTVSLSLTGLEPGTAYALRLFARNEVDGVVHASVPLETLSFTTDTVNPSPTATVSADAVYAAAADLSVLVPRFGYGATAITSLTLRYGTSSDALTEERALTPPADEDGAATCRLTRLAPGTTYYAKAVAVNDLATPASAESPLFSFTTHTVAETRYAEVTATGSLPVTTLSDNGKVVQFLADGTLTIPSGARARLLLVGGGGAGGRE